MAMLSARAPSMLPSIKCSNCGDDIDINMMGEHVCRPARRNQDLPPVPPMPRDNPQPQDASRITSSYFFNPSQMSSAPPNNSSKPSKMVPPKIDSSAANRPYARKDVYASNDGSTAPGRSNVPARKPVDSRAMRQQRNPSEDFAPNLDNPFPSFPPASPAVRTPTQNDGFSSPSFFSGLKAGPPAPAPAPAPPAAYEKSANLAPPKQQQPRRPQSPGFQSQPDMDLNSPSFFSGLKATAPPARAASPYSQQGRDEAKRDEFFTRKPTNASSYSGKNGYNSYGAKELVPGSQPSRDDRNGGPSRPTRPGGEVDNFIASLKEDSRKPNSANPVGLRPTVSRSNTQKSNPLPGLERSPSEPVQQSSNRDANRGPERSATTNDLQGNGYSSYPTRTSSRSGPRNEARDSEGPLPALTYGKTGYEGHYSSNSNSSTASSSNSRDSAFSTGLSTPPSDVSLVSDSKFANNGSTQNKGYGGNPYSSSAYNPYNPYASEEMSKPPQQNGWVPPAKAYAPSPATDYSFDISIYPPSSKDVTPAPRNNPFSNRDRDQTAPRPGLQRTETGSTTASLKPRHSCRGCKQPIVGKSVKASDGRLTGRYHRPCFVCTTCRAPFTSSQVYVLHDRPYCEYHYHALNSSLCASCDTGIEGQYRETEKREKYHPRCLTCRTCRETLSEEYFEVNSNVYCERHAMAEVRRLAQPGPMGAGGGYGGGPAQGGLAPPNGWKAERRRTRLGMM
ncbi:hypothetical protein K461DRAFT_118486 [Myriangium duriaei CBS 260.36]|uniref:LIM zinc-binding domain-containing protein n=1 Tax=Myriangium duriaei CBS 260.36 TaxID=1168546 RepID=A0A9P4ML76_9PEZI|nr:hypothetical protein K461DRAFT_118486 [Myriangium duriaei CBS 260.36]